MKTTSTLFLFIISILPFAVLTFFAVFGVHINTGQGQYTGYITATEKNGLFWKTSRVYLKTELSASNEDKFCVMDEAVLSQLEEASRSQEPVTIKYSSFFIEGLAYCDAEGAFITSVQ